MWFLELRHQPIELLYSPTITGRRPRNDPMGIYNADERQAKSIGTDACDFQDRDTVER